MSHRNGRKPPMGKPNHGRKPPPPRPHASNGRMCRLGQVVGALILGYLAVSTLAIASAW